MAACYSNTSRKYNERFHRQSKLLRKRALYMMKHHSIMLQHHMHLYEKINYELPNKINYEWDKKISYELPYHIRYELPHHINYVWNNKINYESRYRMNYDLYNKPRYEWDELSFSGMVILYNWNMSENNYITNCRYLFLKLFKYCNELFNTKYQLQILVTQVLLQKQRNPKCLKCRIMHNAIIVIFKQTKQLRQSLLYQLWILSKEINIILKQCSNFVPPPVVVAVDAFANIKWNEYDFDPDKEFNKIIAKINTCHKTRILV
jgi:hypothetical protein